MGDIWCKQCVPQQKIFHKQFIQNCLKQSSQYYVQKMKEDIQYFLIYSKPKFLNTTTKIILVGRKAIFKASYESYHKGVIITQNYYYQGNIQEQSAQGYGKVIFLSSFLPSDNQQQTFYGYKGEFENDKCHGEGQYRSLYQYFKGQWKNGYPYKGSIKYKEGNQIQVFKSQIINTQKLYVEIKFPSLNGFYEYQGQISLKLKGYNSKYGRTPIDGYGKMKFPDQSEYQGQWENNQMNGQGVYTWPNGDNFKGQYYRGKCKRGKGVYTLSNGEQLIQENTIGTRSVDSSIINDENSQSMN